MKLRGKLLLLAMLPLLASLGLVSLALRQQQYDLTAAQQELVRGFNDESTRSELRHYVALALSTISPLYNTGRDDEATKREAMRLLAQLDYGADGYFFLYDYDGTNLMHPRQPALVGRNLMDMRDAGGRPAIRRMIETARAGGGFVAYSWNKPSSGGEAPKLAYVSGLDRWHWMIGTGIYTDDVDQVLEQIDRQIEARVHTTMRWIALTAIASIVVIGAVVLGLSWGELKAADAQLTLLARKVVSSQEQERARLSRELHDGTSQTLVSAKLLTESALERLAPQDQAVRPVLSRSLARVNQAIDEVRGMSHRLRPTELDTLGLGTALRQLGEELCSAAGLQLEVDCAASLPDLPDEVKTTLFRVTQEALTNVAKHAQASRVVLQLAVHPGALRLRVADDGRGFDSAAVAAHPRQGIGLRNMRERLEAVGGTLQVHSNGHGTQIVAEVSFPAIERFAKAA